MEYNPNITIETGLALFEEKMKLQERTGRVYAMFTNIKTGAMLLIKSGRQIGDFQTNETYGQPKISDELCDECSKIGGCNGRRTT